MSYEIKDIPKFPGYRADTNGNIWSCKSHRSKGTWIKLKGRSGHGGYPEYKLTINGKGHMRSGHKLVLETFVGPCPKGQICRHFPDQTPTNNKLENIQWGTRSENEKDKVYTNRDNKGFRNGRCKLTEENVKKIKILIKNGDLTYVEIGKRFNISGTHVSYIRDGKTWSSIKEEENI